MSFQPHVDDDVSVMLVIVRRVEHQDSAARDFPFSIWPRDFHQLIES